MRNLELQSLSIYVEKHTDTYAKTKAFIESPKVYRHIRNYYLSNSETFQDGNGNGNLGRFLQMTFKTVIGNQWK